MKNWLRRFLRNARLQRMRSRLEREQMYFGDTFRKCQFSIPKEQDIRFRITNSFPHMKPKSKGDLQILSIYHDYNWEGPSLGPSLSAFGDVRHIDWRDPVPASGKRPGESGWQEAMHEGLLKKVRAWSAEHPFDVVFTYLSGEQMNPASMQALRSLGAPIVNLALNDKESFVGRVRGGHAAGVRDICKYFDLCWTSTVDALEKYVVEGATPLYLPEGANPDVHKPYAEEKIHDVTFVGQCYGNRPEVISRLRRAGVQVEAFGPGWPNGSLPIGEMVKTWSRSRINLGFGGVSNLKETFCLKGRDFEIPMSGGLYLTEHHEELAPFYDIGHEIVTYTGFDDLLKKIHWLLSNPDQAEAIRQAGYKRARNEHTWEMRFEHVFKVLGVLV